MSFLTFKTYDSSYPYRGLLDFIKLYTDTEDIQSSGDINIKVLSNYSGKFQYPIGINNQAHDKYWKSQDIKDSWYTIDFKRFSVKIESYVYQAEEHDFLEWWELMGSNNGIDFTPLCIHYRDKVQEGRVKHLECVQNKNNKKYHQLKILTHGIRTLDNLHHLAIYGLEFYGFLYIGYNSFTIRCQCRCRNIAIFLFISLIKK